jgi:hypothetical protein
MKGISSFNMAEDTSVNWVGYLLTMAKRLSKVFRWRDLDVLWRRSNSLGTRSLRLVKAIKL